MSGSMRARRSAGPALPYTARFIVFRRLICPSAWPLLHGNSTALRTALMSRRKTRANRTIGTSPELTTSSIQMSRAAHQGKLMCSLPQGIDLPRLVDRQHTPGLHAEGRGDYRRDHMAGRRIPYGDSIAGWLMAYGRSRRRTVLARPLGAAPACEKLLQIGETARVAALFDIVEQVSSAAIAVSPGLAKKRLEISASTRPCVGRVACRESAIWRCCAGRSRYDGRSRNRTALPCARREPFRTPSAAIVDERGAPGADALRQRADHPESDRLARSRYPYRAAMHAPWRGPKASSAPRLRPADSA